MQILKDDGVISEVKYGNNFGYVLENSRYFESTSYKFLQSQNNGVFLPCMKILYNGKVELFYIAEEYSPMSALLSGMRPDLFINMIDNIFAGVIETRNNGFLSCQNIDISWDKIFVDINTLKVKFVYLPLNVKQYGSYSEFESIFRSNIIKLAHKVFRDVDGKVEELVSALMDVSMAAEDIYDKFRGVSPSQHDSDISSSESPVVPVMKMVSVNAPQYFGIELGRKEMILGKKQGIVDVVIPFNEKISRRHCRIYQEPDGYYIVDENSTNGTYVNQVRVNGYQPVKIKRGDIISLADSNFQLI